MADLVKGERKPKSYWQWRKNWKEIIACLDNFDLWVNIVTQINATRFWGR